MVSLPAGMAVLERGWLSSNNVVFTQGDAHAVVDTGYRNHVPQTLALIDQALGGDPLHHIVNTHLHSDHAGGNAALQARYPQVRTTIPPGLSEAVKAWDDVALSYRPTGQLCDRFVHDDTLVVDGSVRLGPYDWTVLPADGHDADMVMLWCETQGVLISADALWQNGFGVLFPALNGDLGAFAAQDQTLELIEQLAPRLVIPGHGAPFTEVDAALQTARSRLNWLAQDPRRHAQAALKGLLAFTLLDRQHMPQQDVIDLIDHGLMSQPGFKAAFDEAPPQLAQWAVDQLTRVGVARWDGQALQSCA
ncbi:MAG TPA: MBL fold metallo-hydrolase [Aquabacterium sp.]|nr:MBL fold metallo-hydrolase [Aquabacterium sp.]HRH29683.1 MBL fold metallo-hydrolase [Aquabacterium sp.]